MSKLREQIITLIEDLQEAPTVYKRMQLNRLALKYSVHTDERKVTDPVILLVEDKFIDWSPRKGGLEYLLHAHVCFLNQVYEVYITGVLHYIELSAGSDGDYFNGPYGPETKLSHAWFNDILITLTGDPNEEPVPMPEKTLIDLTVDFFEEENYQELVH